MPGNLIVSGTPQTLRTTLGSCIAVCLFDPHLGYGGMNHYIYSRSSEADAGYSYGNLSIPELIKKMTDLGSRVSSLQASLAGGASRIIPSNGLSAGQKNIQVAEEILLEYRIPVVSRNVGGCYGRKVRYSTGSGVLEVELLEDCLSACSTTGKSCRTGSSS